MVFTDLSRDNGLTPMGLALEAVTRLAGSFPGPERFLDRKPSNPLEGRARQYARTHSGDADHQAIFRPDELRYANRRNGEP
jgi:hypothetical protein